MAIGLLGDVLDLRLRCPFLCDLRHFRGSGMEQTWSADGPRRPRNDRETHLSPKCRGLCLKVLHSKIIMALKVFRICPK